MNIDYNKLIYKIKNVEKIASSNKLSRLLQKPLKYIFAIFYQEVLYKVFKRSVAVQVDTFFGTKMKVLLPAGTDIYITSGKSHNSEIRLAKYLIKTLKTGNTFLDVGAHFGYFSLLASLLVDDEGSVISFEPSPKSFAILKENTILKQNTTILNHAVSDQKEIINFYEFPNRYSEYNSTDVTQYEELPWFKKNLPKCIKIETEILSEYITTKTIDPDIIKIDVEGGELKVIYGLKDYLNQSSPIIIMEFLADGRINKPHILAENLLRSMRYHSFVITADGEIFKITNIATYMSERNCDSENIVFKRTNN